MEAQSAFLVTACQRSSEGFVSGWRLQNAISVLRAMIRMTTMFPFWELWSVF